MTISYDAGKYIFAVGVIVFGYGVYALQQSQDAANNIVPVFLLMLGGFLLIAGSLFWAIGSAKKKSKH